MKSLMLILVALFAPALAGSQTPKGYAVLIGLGTVDVQAYPGKTYGAAAVSGTAKDLARMRELLSGYEVFTLQDQEATRANVIAITRTIGRKVSPGDLFVFYFSGHGDQVPDQNGDEPDHMDEVLVTYDGYLVDDSLQALFARYFRHNTNIMVVDACHSSSSYKLPAAAMHDYEMRRSSVKSVFRNERLVEEQTASESPCSLGQRTGEDEPYPLIYYGATGDDGQALGNSSGGLLTATMYGYMQYYQKRGALAYLDYRKLACLLRSAMKFQPLQYHEIGPLPETITQHIPFKLLKP